MELLSTIIFIVCFYHGLRLVFFMIKEIKNAIKGLIKETTTEQTGYSEEYLETYGAEVWMYTVANQDPTDLDGALTRAKDMCEWLYNTTDEQRAENMQRNWEKAKANLE